MTFSASGLTSLQFRGEELLARGDFNVHAVQFQPPEGKAYAGSLEHTTTVDSTKRTERLTFPWGAVSVQYMLRPEALDLAIETVNRTRVSLRALSFDVLALRFPRRPAEYDGSVPMLATNIGAPSTLRLTYGVSSVTLCNEDVRRPLLVAFPWGLDKPLNRTFPLRINTGREAMYPDSLPVIERPIAAGASDTFRLSLRFRSAPGGAVARSSHSGAAASYPPRPSYEVAADLYSLFARANPFALRWTDRRPIGSLIIATAAAGWPKNPRGWLLDPKIDVTTERGKAEFRSQLLAWADRSVAILRNMSAQGMVTWDIEGEQFPHATTYIGDPRLAETLAPEMGGVLDEYFARFRRAGMRVGVTIRPQTAVLREGGRRVEQTGSADAAQVLIDKIAYARKRWGATLFYIDSNGDPALPTSFEVMKRVAEAEPDVLLMPEHKNAAYYSRTAPYSELRGGSAATPELVRSIYRNAFSVINTADGAVDRAYPELQKAVAQGDILMFRAWFDDPANIKVKRLTTSRKARAPGAH